MHGQRLPDGFETSGADDQLLTESMVMWESDVSRMLGDDPNEAPGSPDASGIEVSGLLLSRREELLLLALFLLALLID